MKAIYYAILSACIDGSFDVRVPDLPGCVTSGENLADAMDQATDAANLWVYSAEKRGYDIPKPTDPCQIKPAQGEIATLLKIDTEQYRRKLNHTTVRKNVSIPRWMAEMVDERNLNCSKILQDALRDISDNN